MVPSVVSTATVLTLVLVTFIYLLFQVGGFVTLLTFLVGEGIKGGQDMGEMVRQGRDVREPLV